MHGYAWHGRDRDSTGTLSASSGVVMLVMSYCIFIIPGVLMHIRIAIMGKGTNRTIAEKNEGIGGHNTRIRRQQTSCQSPSAALIEFQREASRKNVFSSLCGHRL
jgi:hypothetical protein